MTMLADRTAVSAANDLSPHAAGIASNDFVFVAGRAAAPPDDCLPMEAEISVGFGIATLTRDGIVVYEESGGETDGPISVSQAEQLAQTHPDRDWRIHLVALLEDRHYRRTGKGLWKLYKRGYGLS